MLCPCLMTQFGGAAHIPLSNAPHPPLFAVTVLMVFDQFAPAASTKSCCVAQGLRTPELRIAMSLDEIGWLPSSLED